MAIIIIIVFIVITIFLDSVTFSSPLGGGMWE